MRHDGSKFIFITVILLSVHKAVAMVDKQAEPVQGFIPEQDSPYYINVDFIGESVSNLRGGLKTGTDYNALLHASFSMNATEIGMPEGGRFRVSAITINSGQPSLNLIGDIQIASNIEAENDTLIYDAWFRQDFSRVPLRLRIGIIDANEYFNLTEGSAVLLNSSFGISPSMSDNVRFSIFPKPGYGITARYDAESAKILLGVFDGDPSARSIPFNVGLLYVTEWQQRITDDVGFKLGGWSCHCLSLQEPSIKDKTYGIYGSIESKFKDTDNREITLFLRSGASHGTDTNISNSFALGVYYPSMLSARPNDEFSAGITQARFDGGGAETSYELTYLWQIRDSLTIQPDFQYIVSPSGYLPDAWVFIVRLNFSQDKHFR
jgi:porin